MSLGIKFTYYAEDILKPGDIISVNYFNGINMVHIESYKFIDMYSDWTNRVMSGDIIESDLSKFFIVETAIGKFKICIMRFIGSIKYILYVTKISE